MAYAVVEALALTFGTPVIGSKRPIAVPASSS